MARYREKPVYVQAEVFDGSPESVEKIKEMAGELAVSLVYRKDLGEIHIYRESSVRRVRPGQHIILTSDGVFIPCDPGAFIKLYEEVSE